MMLDGWQTANYIDTLFDSKANNYYQQDKKKEQYTEDCLIIGVDFSPDESDLMVVMRRKGDDTYIINRFRNDEAVELYNKLIGK